MSSSSLSCSSRTMWALLAGFSNLSTGGRDTAISRHTGAANLRPPPQGPQGPTLSCAYRLGTTGKHGPGLHPGPLSPPTKTRRRKARKRSRLARGTSSGPCASEPESQCQVVMWLFLKWTSKFTGNLEFGIYL